MTSDNRARLRVAALIFTMVNAVVFGVGLVSVLTTPVLAQHGFFWIPAIVVSSFVISPPLSWFIAPMMMQRFIQSSPPQQAGSLRNWLQRIWRD